MKISTILPVLGIALSSSGLAAIGPGDSCRVASVNESENFLEEGLGKFGDPSVDSDSQEFSFTIKQGRIQKVRLGQGTWTNPRGGITMTTQGANQVIRITSAGGNDGLKVVIYPSDRAIVLKTKANGTSAVLASLDCLNVAGVSEAAPSDANVRLLSDDDFSDLPYSVRTEMATTDVPFELGDGYYDLKSSQLYEVVSKTNSNLVLGYIEISELYYTEGDDVIATVRYDRNGLRLGEIETETP